MDAYIALMFCKAEEVKSYGKEVGGAIQNVSGGKLKYMESAPGVAAVAFVTSRPKKDVHAAFSDLWRREQRTWVIPIDPANPAAMIDKSLMDWVRKNLAA